jgi:predicted phosphodiesterase
MLHIAGYPGKYKPEALELIRRHQPDIFVTGHSHILKVMFDKKHQHLHINPGAMGLHGFHQVRTLVSLELDAGKIQNANVIELKKFS